MLKRSIAVLLITLLANIPNYAVAEPKHTGNLLDLAKSKGFNFGRLFGGTVSRGAPNSAEQGDSKVLLEPDVAAQNMKSVAKHILCDNEETSCANSNENSGYVHVYYSFVDSTSNTWDLSDGPAKSIFSRTIKDWARSIFIKKEREFVLTLEALQGGQVVDTKPVLALKYSDDFSVIEETLTQKLNGFLGFPRPSSDPIEVRLRVHYSDGIDSSRAVAVLGAVAEIAAGVGIPQPISSVFDPLDIPAVRNARDGVKTALSSFKAVTAISKDVSLQWNSEQRPRGFLYHFKAPNLGASEVVKLRVQLDYSPSLLVRNGQEFSANAVLSRPVFYPPEDSFPTLLNFIERDAQVRVTLPKLSASNVKPTDVLTACRTIREALQGARYSGADVARGFEAFVRNNNDKFSASWNPECYDPIAIELTNAGIKPLYKFADPLASNEQRAPSTRELFDFVDAFVFLLETQASPTYSSRIEREIMRSRETFAEHLDQGVVQVVDEKVLSSLSESGTYGSGGLYRLALAQHIPTAGCYSRDIFRTEEQPNIVGLLAENKNKTVLILIDFARTAMGAAKIAPKNISIKPADTDTLTKFSSIFPNGCEGGYAPWKARVATSSS